MIGLDLPGRLTHIPAALNSAHLPPRLGPCLDLVSQNYSQSNFHSLYLSFPHSSKVQCVRQVETESNLLLGQLPLERVTHCLECLPQLSVTSTEVRPSVGQKLKRLLLGDETSKGHEKCVSVHALQQIQMNAPGCETLVYNRPTLLGIQSGWYRARSSLIQ